MSRRRRGRRRRPRRRLSGRSRARTSQSLTAPSASCARFPKPAVRRARADSGVEVHYYDARCSSDARGTTNASSEKTNASSQSRVFVIPDTAGASAVASDVSRLRLRLRGRKRTSPWRARGRKRVVVYAVPPLLTTRGEATVVFDIAADIILGLAHPARAMTWLGATLVIGTPRGAVARALARPVQRRPSPAFSETAPVSPKRAEASAERARAAALAALAPRRPSPGGASYETMFGSDPIGSRADEAEDDGGEATEAPARRRWRWRRRRRRERAAAASRRRARRRLDRRARAGRNAPARVAS